VLEDVGSGETVWEKEGGMDLLKRSDPETECVVETVWDTERDASREETVWVDLKPLEVAREVGVETTEIVASPLEVEDREARDVAVFLATLADGDALKEGEPEEDEVLRNEAVGAKIEKLGLAEVVVLGVDVGAFGEAVRESWAEGEEDKDMTSDVERWGESELAIVIEADAVGGAVIELVADSENREDGVSEMSDVNDAGLVPEENTVGESEPLVVALNSPLSDFAALGDCAAERERDALLVINALSDTDTEPVGVAEEHCWLDAEANEVREESGEADEKLDRDGWFCVDVSEAAKDGVASELLEGNAVHVMSREDALGTALGEVKTEGVANRLDEKDELPVAELVILRTMEAVPVADIVVVPLIDTIADVVADRHRLPEDDGVVLALGCIVGELRALPLIALESVAPPVLLAPADRVALPDPETVKLKVEQVEGEGVAVSLFSSKRKVEIGVTLNEVMREALCTPEEVLDEEEEGDSEVRALPVATLVLDPMEEAEASALLESDGDALFVTVAVTEIEDEGELDEVSKGLALAVDVREVLKELVDRPDAAADALNLADRERVGDVLLVPQELDVNTADEDAVPKGTVSVAAADSVDEAVREKDGEGELLGMDDPLLVKEGEGVPLSVGRRVALTKKLCENEIDAENKGLLERVAVVEEDKEELAELVASAVTLFDELTECDDEVQPEPEKMTEKDALKVDTGVGTLPLEKDEREESVGGPDTVEETEAQVVMLFTEL
jgi:hypothetical protein